MSDRRIVIRVAVLVSIFSLLAALSAAPSAHAGIGIEKVLTGKADVVGQVRLVLPRPPVECIGTTCTINEDHRVFIEDHDAFTTFFDPYQFDPDLEKFPEGFAAVNDHDPGSYRTTPMHVPGNGADMEGGVFGYISAGTAAGSLFIKATTVNSGWVQGNAKLDLRLEFDDLVIVPVELLPNPTICESDCGETKTIPGRVNMEVDAKARTGGVPDLEPRPPQLGGAITNVDASVLVYLDLFSQVDSRGFPIDPDRVYFGYQASQSQIVFDGTDAIFQTIEEAEGQLAGDEPPVFDLPLLTFIAGVLNVQARVEFDLRGRNVSAEAMVDFRRTVNFPTSGPVFDLPPGYTAYSQQLQIVDNRWVGTIIPEPSAYLFAVQGIAALYFHAIVRRNLRNRRHARRGVPSAAARTPSN